MKFFGVINVFNCVKLSSPTTLTRPPRSLDAVLAYRHQRRGTSLPLQPKLDFPTGMFALFSESQILIVFSIVFVVVLLFPKGYFPFTTRTNNKDVKLHDISFF